MYNIYFASIHYILTIFYLFIYFRAHSYAPCFVVLFEGEQSGTVNKQTADRTLIALGRYLKKKKTMLVCRWRDFTLPEMMSY